MSFLRASTSMLRRGCLLGRKNRCFSTAFNQEQDDKKPNNGIDVDFLKEIANESSKHGRRFVLPVSDSTAMKRILEPLVQMTDEGGIKTESLKDILSSSPDLFMLISQNGGHCFKLLNLLSDFCGFTFENSLRFIVENLDDIDVSKYKEMGESLNILTGLGFLSGAKLGSMIWKCPALLYSSTAPQISQTYENLAMFFPKKSIAETLIPHAPHILLKPFEEIELKYEYIYFHMSIEPEKLALSFDWIDMDLEEVIMRHDFLRKTGKYITPDPKKPQYEQKNPPAFRIFDTSDFTFATEVACVPEEEWTVFQEVYKKTKSNEGKDQPYERIKPSIRKKYERRVKEAADYEEHYIEHI